jgi:hypothetical protein
VTDRRKMLRSVQSLCFGSSAIVCLAIWLEGSVVARASPASAPGELVEAARSATGQDQLSPACDDSPMSTACPQQDPGA